MHKGKNVKEAKAAGTEIAIPFMEVPKLGKIAIYIDDVFAIRMTGPATRVASMNFDEEALSFRVEG